MGIAPNFRHLVRKMLIKAWNFYLYPVAFPIYTYRYVGYKML